MMVDGWLLAIGWLRGRRRAGEDVAALQGGGFMVIAAMHCGFVNCLPLPLRACMRRPGH